MESEVLKNVFFKLSLDCFWQEVKEALAIVGPLLDEDDTHDGVKHVDVLHIPLSGSKVKELLRDDFKLELLVCEGVLFGQLDELWVL